MPELTVGFDIKTSGSHTEKGLGTTQFDKQACMDHMASTTELIHVSYSGVATGRNGKYMCPQSIVKKEKR